MGLSLACSQRGYNPPISAKGDELASYTNTARYHLIDLHVSNSKTGKLASNWLAIKLGNNNREQ